MQSTIALPSAPVARRNHASDRQAFWEFADEAKEATEALAVRRMQALARMPPDAMRWVCTQYRFFTVDYISDLALLVAKLEFGGLRSLLGRILSEELGDGDGRMAHPAVYDRFLASIGVEPAQLEKPLPANRAILGSLSHELSGRSPAFGVGLRGMGGECLCQTYLSVMHEFLRLHPYVREHECEIDWEFWAIHTGEQDIVHGEMTRRAIDDHLREEPGALPELAQGYERSIAAWNRFWLNIFDACSTRWEQVS